MKQSSFSDLAYEHKKKTTRKERFSQGDGCNTALGGATEVDIDHIVLYQGFTRVDDDVNALRL